MNEKVFVVNKSTHDYTPASDFGELVFMTMGILDLKYIKKYQENIRAYISEATRDDFLLFSGQHLVCAVALSEWQAVHGSCKVLLYDDRNKQYNLFHITE